MQRRATASDKCEAPFMELTVYVPNVTTTTTTTNNNKRSNRKEQQKEKVATTMIVPYL